jgi:hypothetical protein
MGKRGRLKIAWLRPCRFESCPGHHPDSWFALERDQSVQLIPHSRSNVVGREQILECIAIEQRHSLVAQVGALDLDPIDLLWIVEDLADSQGLFVMPFENLCSQGVDDSVASPVAERERIHRIRCGATCVSEEFEGSGRFHGKAKHTQRRSRDSSMNRHVVQAANSPGPATFRVACNEQASNRQQGLRR